MNNTKWGVKRQCQECGAHSTTSSGARWFARNARRPSRSRPSPRSSAPSRPRRRRPPLAPLKELAEKSGDTEMSAEDKVLKEFTADILTDNNLAADDDDDEDENSFEDASELGKDEDDMAEVIDGGRKVDES